MLFNSWRRNILINQSILKPSQRTLAYKFQQVDKKWQQKWSSEPSTEHPNPSADDKLYILGQFPYPSGNIHMGHVRVYTICDVLTRYYKSKGKQVINPMGWDSFGLPAENAAIQRNIHPKPWTAQNIQDMKAQLVRMGFVFDWDRELATHEPAYYKHTQEIFSMLNKHGLAYKKDAYVNWDPVDQTVLANEQIDDKGRSWRSGAIVEKKLLRQWFLNIRKYADEMLDDLNHLDKWNETVKESQRGWIGKNYHSNRCRIHNIGLCIHGKISQLYLNARSSRATDRPSEVNMIFLQIKSWICFVVILLFQASTVCVRYPLGNQGDVSLPQKRRPVRTLRNYWQREMAHPHLRMRDLIIKSNSD